MAKAGNPPRCVESGKAGVAEDLVFASFLSFLAADMTRSPRQTRPLRATLVARMDRLTQGMRTDPDEDLSDDALI